MLRWIEECLPRVVAGKLELPDPNVYGAKIDDQQYYRLAYGIYATFADALQSFKKLPSDIARFRTFPRSVARVARLNRQSSFEEKKRSLPAASTPHVDHHRGRIALVRLCYIIQTGKLYIYQWRGA
jgi:hypothetical protein